MLLETLEVICLLTFFGSEIYAKRSLAQHPYVEYIPHTSPQASINLENSPREVTYVFGSDRSPRRGDLVHVSVRPCGTFLKSTLQMSF